MFCYVRGVNHNSAPVEVREELAFASSEVGKVLDVFSQEDIQESFIIATCNRTEFYVAGNPREELSRITSRVIGRLAGVEAAQEPSYWYERRDRHAVEHLFRVAGGLDSMVLGEPEILGQVKHSFEVAREADTVGVFFNEVFKRCCHVAKRVRTETALGVGSVSVASAARDVLSKELGSLKNRRILLVGTGEIAEQMGQHLADEPLSAFYVASRTPERAQRLAAAFGGRPVPTAQIGETMLNCDGLVAASSSTEPIVTMEHAAPVASNGRPSPFVFIDLAIPRNVDPTISELPSASLYAIDDLRSVIEQNLVRRKSELPLAEAIIDEETGRLAQWHTSLGVMESLKAFRSKFEDLRQSELERLRTRLSAEEWKAVDEASRRIMAKMLHTPTLALKTLDVSDPADNQKLELLREIFDLPS